MPFGSAFEEAAEIVTEDNLNSLSIKIIMDTAASAQDSVDTMVSGYSASV
jgi:hypothetical protein